MHIVFLTHYFPPEVNAPASRTYENTRRWVHAGHRVTVITCAPNHPNGILYPGYANRWFQWDETDGIRILRVKTYLSANKGVKKRIMNYVSYLLSASVFSLLVRNVDIVVSTSPQFFCGMAGFLVSRLKRVPWVLEIRDLWPESIIAVGALKQPAIIALLESVETFLYRRAHHVVALTHAFKRHIVGRSVPEQKVSIITNGADLERFVPAARDNRFRTEHRLEKKFVIAYVGTHGMAHGLDTVFEAAEHLRDRSDIVFLLVGDGAERERLLQLHRDRKMANVIMLPQQPKAAMPEILAASDACMVLLRDTPLFRTVIPSKIFEAMAMRRPIVLGVRGESQEIIERGDCGICIEPESAGDLARAVTELADHPENQQRLGENGRRFVKRWYDREGLARAYRRLLERVWARSVKTKRTGDGVSC